MKNKKKLILIIIAILIIAAIITIGISFINKKRTSNIPKENQEEIQTPILGEDRLNGQTKVLKIINKYLDDIPNLNEYGKNNNLKVVSLKKLSEDFKFNINEFDNLEYDCKSETTTISFNETYDNYTISLDCKKFYLK